MLTKLNIKILKLAAQICSNRPPLAAILTQEEQAWLVDKFKLGRFPQDETEISHLVGDVLNAMIVREEMIRLVDEMAASGEFDKLR